MLQPFDSPWGPVYIDVAEVAALGTSATRTYASDSATSSIPTRTVYLRGGSYLTVSDTGHNVERLLRGGRRSGDPHDPLIQFACPGGRCVYIRRSSIAMVSDAIETADGCIRVVTLTHSGRDCTILDTADNAQKLLGLS